MRPEADGVIRIEDPGLFCGVALLVVIPLGRGGRGLIGFRGRVVPRT